MSINLHMHEGFLSVQLYARERFLERNSVTMEHMARLVFSLLPEHQKVGREVLR